MKFVPFDEDYESKVSWEDMNEGTKLFLLREAYLDKSFRECPEHIWQLEIEFGQISISCINCRGFYSELNPEYQEDLCFTTRLSSLEYKSESTYGDYGTEFDSWLEAT